jgi:RNA 2',3'-cyclic 3'-phosphodiesterase
MRLFVALDINHDIRAGIARFLDGVREFAPDARWIRPEALHVTLKFIGERSPEDVENIHQALGMIQAGAFEINLRGYGFFPGAGAPRVFWIGCEGGTSLSSLAAAVDEALAPVGIPQEEHAYNAHLTLARGGGRGSGSPRKQERYVPKHTFQRLQEKLSALPAPEFGTMTAREFFLYQSQLSPGGSKYTKLVGFALR